MKKVYIICLTIFMYHFTNAQNKITGKITDQDNLPLSGTTIHIPDLNKRTIANSNAIYKLINLPNGNIKQLIGNKVVVCACPTCLKIAGFKPEDLIDGVQVAQKEKFFNFTKGRIITLDY